MPSYVNIQEFECLICGEDYALGVHDLRLFFRGRPICSWRCMGHMWTLWFKAVSELRKARKDVDDAVLPYLALQLIEATKGGIVVGRSH